MQSDITRSKGFTSPRGAIALAGALLLVGTGFRCPGPEPSSEATSTQGGGNQGGAATDTSATGAPTSSANVSGTGGTGGGCAANLDTDPSNCGSCGRACSANGTANVRCTLGECDSTCTVGLVNLSRPVAPLADDGCEASGSRVFVTSTPVLADFGGSLAGDTKCQTYADAAQLGGSWKAWISDEVSSPAARFLQSANPYFLLDGTMIATDWTDLTDGLLLHAIDVDENEIPVPLAEVWTGTNTDGTVAVGNSICFNWASIAVTDVADVGRTDVADAQWTAIFVQSCERNNVHLYCFEQ